jgi:hypothetical protein
MKRLDSQFPTLLDPLAAVAPKPAPPDPVALVPVVAAYRMLGRTVRREVGDGPQSGRTDCILPATEHRGPRRETVRIHGSKWNCEVCRNGGDTADLLAFRAGLPGASPIEETEAIERERELRARLLKRGRS